MRDGPHVALVEQDGAADGRDDGADAEAGAALGGDDGGGLALRRVGYRPQVELARRQRPADRDAADRARRPGDELRVAVLAQHVRVDGRGRHARVLGQQPAQPDRVEEGAGADDLVPRQAGDLLREVGQDVDRVGDEEEDGVRFERLHVRDATVEDLEVAADEVDAGLAWTGLSVQGEQTWEIWVVLEDLACVPSFCFAPAVMTTTSDCPASLCVAARIRVLELPLYVASLRS